MPLRTIEIPNPIKIQGKELDFRFILDKLMCNPKWGASYNAMRAQRSILSAHDKRVDGKMVLSEEDWLMLKDAVERPVVAAFAPDGSPAQMPGLGIMPSLASELLPLLQPIMDAAPES